MPVYSNIKFYTYNRIECLGKIICCFFHLAKTCHTAAIILVRFLDERKCFRGGGRVASMVLTSGFNL